MLEALGLSSLDPDRPVLEDDGETEPTKSFLEPEASRGGLEVEQVGPGLELERTSEFELRLNSGLKPGLVLRLKLALESEGVRVLGSRSSFDAMPDLEPATVLESELVLLALISVAVLESRLSLEPILDLQLELALELEPVLESKLSFDPKLVLEAEPLFESRLSLDPIAVLELGLALESRLSLVAVVALEFELDLELVLDPEPTLESLLSRFSLDPDALLFLVPEVFFCVDGLGLKELGWGVLVLSSAISAL